MAASGGSGNELLPLPPLRSLWGLVGALRDDMPCCVPGTDLLVRSVMHTLVALLWAEGPLGACLRWCFCWPTQHCLCLLGCLCSPRDSDIARRVLPCACVAAIVETQGRLCGGDLGPPCYTSYSVQCCALAYAAFMCGCGRVVGVVRWLGGTLWCLMQRRVLRGALLAWVAVAGGSLRVVVVCAARKGSVALLCPREAHRVVVDMSFLGGGCLRVAAPGIALFGHVAAWHPQHSVVAPLAGQQSMRAYRCGVAVPLPSACRAVSGSCGMRWPGAHGAVVWAVYSAFIADPNELR